MKVLWIGYGKMGEPMCGRVVEAGHQVSVLDNGPAQRAAAKARGLSLVGDTGGAAAEADAIVTSLPNDAAACSVLAGAGSVLAQARAGSILIETSTISVGASLAIAEAAAARGAVYVRARFPGRSAPHRREGCRASYPGPPTRCRNPRQPFSTRRRD